jgi:hypothetical protein
MEMMQLEIGQLWWDEFHKCTDGSDTIDVVNLIISADQEGDLYIYKCAFFMWAGKGYCGAPIRGFTEEEIKQMTLVGNISEIKSFNT